METSSPSITLSKSEKPLYNKHFLWQPHDAGPRSFGLYGPENSSEAKSLLALLHFKSAVGTLAQGEANFSCWTFKRCGIWQPFLSVRALPEEKDLGIYRRLPGLGTGILSLKDGSRYRVSEAGLTEGITLFSAQGEVLLNVKTKEKKRLFADCHVSDKLNLSVLSEQNEGVPGDINHVPQNDFLLLIFAWYLQLLSFMDDAEVKTMKKL